MVRGAVGILMAIARESARNQRRIQAAEKRANREAEKQARAAIREIEQRERTAYRQAIINEKERAREEKARYLASREQEVVDLNEAVFETLESIASLLAHTLTIDDSISFDSLRIHDQAPPFTIPEALRPIADGPSREAYTGAVQEPGSLWGLLPGAKKKYEMSMHAAQEAYKDAVSAWKRENARRSMELMARKQRYTELVQAFEAKKAQRNVEVDAFEQAYKASDPDAIVAYSTMVLERSEYPDGLPQKFSVAYTAASKLLVVEYQLPDVSIVPKVAEYRYVRAGDKIATKLRKQGEIVETYQEVISSIALRSIHELFEADQCGHVAAICFNGFIHTIDPATGRDIQPHLISIRTTKERFSEIDLARVDKRICLKNLGAQVSRRPDEAQPVKPVVEFNMADVRFVDQSDLASGLSSATNLMDLNPYEFEQLVANLFGQMGLESKLTRSSRDGGVDCVAYDARPVLGGKVVIQAKRYRNTVGVSAVRDLFGTMMNEGANKGILVTTSGYGPDAFDFAKDKPIELIDGGGLLFLLQGIGIEARIVFPEQEA
jgi:restriction system protein